MKKTILALSFAFFILLLVAHKAQAAVLFSDDFESGTSKWNVLQGNWVIRDGKYGAIASDNLHNNESIANYDITTPDYNIELDMYPIQGIDRTIRFRRDSNAPGGVYDIHFTNDGIPTNFGPGPNYALINYPYELNHAYHIKVILKGKHIQFYIDSNLVIDYIDQNYVFDGHESFSLVVATGSVPTEVYFDNVKIYTDDQGLNVPLLKQTDPQWKDDIYDSANLWSSGGITIADWGCAVTSAAMVFQYNGLTKMQDNSNLDPRSLNSWLKGQQDGYTRNGSVNWLALSRLSKQISSQNGVSFDALEYSRHGFDNNYLTQNLQNQVPAILEEPNHFIVAKGVDIDNSTYLINDPFYTISSLSDSKYNNNYLSQGTYSPVNSDLSYMMFVVNPNANITLLDQNNNSVGDTSIEDPIADPNNNSTNSVGSLKYFYLPKPGSGSYTLNVSSPNGGPYTLDEYFYDKDGNVKMFTVNGNGTDNYVINFDKDNSNNSTSHKLVTFDLLRQEIIDGYNNHEIDFGTHIALLSLLDNAQKAKKADIARKMLDQMEHLITVDSTISFDFSQQLISDINTLKNSL